MQDLLDEFEGEEVPPKVQVIRTRAQKLLLQIHSVHGREHDRVHDGGALDGLY